MNLPNYSPTYPTYPAPYMQQSYADRMAQLNQMYANAVPVQNPQQVQPMPQANVRQVSGRYVSSAEEVAASEVPMDGSVSIFPKADLSEMYAKAWKPDGTIQTVIYKPFTQKADEHTSDRASQRMELSEESMSFITDNFKAIFERLDALGQSIASGSKTARRNTGNES